MVVESLAVPGDDSTWLFTSDRYAKARNVYFIPTPAALVAMLERGGFRNIEVCSFVKLETYEQRKTKLMQYESLEDFLLVGDETKTVEGHPAPWRVLIKATL